MIRMRALGAVLALALAAPLGGCTPINGTGGQATGGPPAAAAPAGGYEVYFNVEVLGPPGANGRRPYTRQVIITVEALQADGQYASYFNPATGQTARGPFNDVRTTPVRHGVTFGTGVVSGTLTAVYAGYSDEQLSCWVDRDGLELPGTRDTETIGPTVNGRGGARVTCHYVPAA